MALKRGNGDEPGISKKGGKVKLKKLSLNEGKYTIEQANKDYASSIKSGKMVSINDPSIDPTTRKFVMGAIGSSDYLGKRVDVSIPKGYKASSYKDIYGVDYNPEEFRAAAKGKDFDKYLSQKGLSAGQSFIPNFGYQSRYETEGDRLKAKEDNKVKLKDELGEPKNIKLTRLPLLKPKLTTKKGELAIGSATSEPVEKADWKPAGGVKTKSRIVKPKNVKTGEYIGQNLKYAAQRVAGKNPVLRPGVTKEKLVANKGDRYLNQGKAYFSNYENQGLASIKEKRAALKESKADLKADIKTARQEGNRERVALYRNLKKDYNAELRQNKLAGKYVKNVGREYIGVGAGQELENTGRVKVNTPKTFAGFLGSNQDTFDKYAKSDKYIRKSTDNAVNRNSTDSKIKLANRRNR